MNGFRGDVISRAARTSRSRRAVLTSAALALPALALARSTGAAGAFFPPVRPAGSPAASDAPFDGRFDVGGGRMLHLYATGVGGPTVVLDAGYGSGWTDWRLVQPAIAASARVVSYDRANVGESDPGPTPRTSADAVADLHALLRAAGLPAPYLLVGHSYGGTNALLYASTHPEEIAGLVLVDAVHEEYRDRLRELDPEQMATLDQLLAIVPEGVDFDATSALIREAGPLPAVPTVVVARGVGDFPPLAPTAETEQLWQELQRDLASRIPGADLVVAERSGHTVPKDQPEAIVEAIRRVLAAVREPLS